MKSSNRFADGGKDLAEWLKEREDAPTPKGRILAQARAIVDERPDVRLPATRAALELIVYGDHLADGAE